MLVRLGQLVRVERNVLWVIQLGVQGVLAEREATVHPSKEREEGMGVPLLRRPQSSADQPAQLGGRMGVQTADLAERRADPEVWRPSVVPLEALGDLRVGPAERRADQVVLHPLEELLEALGVQPVDPVGQVVDLRQEAPVGLRPSVVLLEGLGEMRVDHWGVVLVAPQKHRVVELKRADLLLLGVLKEMPVDPAGLLPSVVPREALEETREDLQQGAQAVQEPVQRFRLQRHLQRIQVLPEEGFLPLPWPPIDAPILWRRYHRSRLSLRPP